MHCIIHLHPNSTAPSRRLLLRLLISRYEAYLGGRAGFAEHAATPHFARWAEFKATAPFAAPAVVAYYTVEA